MKKSLRERMEEASLHELMPDFNKEEGWGQLRAQLHTTKQKPLLTWQRAAAIILLIVAGGIVSLVLVKGNNSADMVARADTGTSHNWVDDVTPAVPQQRSFEQVEYNDAQDVANNSIPPAGSEPAVKPVMAYRTQQQGKIQPTLQLHETHRTEEFLCNGTRSPLEICIIQTIHCKDRKTAIATCNTLEPDQARQLHYKAPNSAGVNCKVTVDEITIRRVSTGETIVLNAHSKPSTAQEVFNCITGHDKCDLLAGSIKIDNNFGNLTMQ